MRATSVGRYMSIVHYTGLEEGVVVSCVMLAKYILPRI